MNSHYQDQWNRGSDGRIGDAEARVRALIRQREEAIADNVVRKLDRRLRSSY